jgi:hypothetical protein
MPDVSGWLQPDVLVVLLDPDLNGMSCLPSAALPTSFLYKLVSPSQAGFTDFPFGLYVCLPLLLPVPTCRSTSWYGYFTFKMEASRSSETLVSSHYTTVLQLKRPWLESSLLWKPLGLHRFTYVFLLHMVNILQVWLTLPMSLLSVLILPWKLKNKVITWLNENRTVIMHGRNVLDSFEN